MGVAAGLGGVAALGEVEFGDLGPPIEHADADAGLERSQGKKPARLGSLAELFGDPRWRRNTIVGMILAFAGVVGLWGIGFFSFDLVDVVFRKHFEGQGLSSQQISGKLTFWKGITSLLQNGGAFFGIYAFARITQVIGRKPAFAISFVLAAVATAATFWFLDTFWQIFVLIPIMGFCQLAIFGGYAIYFPELFPTRLRSTGTSFCYNVGRLVAAAARPSRDCSRAGCLPASPSRCGTRGSRCARCSWSGSSRCRLLRRPRGSRCRSECPHSRASLGRRLLGGGRRHFQLACECVTQCSVVNLQLTAASELLQPEIDELLVKLVGMIGACDLCGSKHLGFLVHRADDRLNRCVRRSISTVFLTTSSLSTNRRSPGKI